MPPVTDFRALNKSGPSFGARSDTKREATMKSLARLVSNHPAKQAAATGRLPNACRTSHNTMEDQPDVRINEVQVQSLLYQLDLRGISVQRTDGRNPPPEALLHDPAAEVPLLVISPRSEWGVEKSLRLLNELGFHGTNQIPISVKSGGHGYFNGASCRGIMLNLSEMNNASIADNTLMVQPGCVLGKTIHLLAQHRKAVPHGDCFGVGAGGHFLTAGWDLILARRYGLGCQSVIGGRIVLWDGSAVEVSEDQHPDLLHAMRGGAAAGVGVVTEIRLRLIKEPPLATWCFTPITREQLETCVHNDVISNALCLPRDISVSFRFHFDANQPGTVCSFNIVSLLPVEDTIECLYHHLGHDIASMVADRSRWSEKTLLSIRMLPASKVLAANPNMLAELTATKLHEDPLTYWNESSTSREMARSYQTSISHWVKPNCERMLLGMYTAFQSAQTYHERHRLYGLVILGGGRMLEAQDQCSMPLGQVLARAETHWDQPGGEDESWCRDFTELLSDIIRSEEDTKPGRPYRGDIWKAEQAKDIGLDAIAQKYDRRRG
ncbi:methyl transferase [Purpureocillium lavendulum]|uniref:Methyl transferase n=1 Tax=Purpureocillium lavendulum TaxID=1247861 RepID=A0AB34FCV6_9HYPO|nr:methyl transferase [Purpureocillium lavendulum]